MTVYDIAEVAYEAVRAYRKLSGTVCPAWDNASYTEHWRYADAVGSLVYRDGKATDTEERLIEAVTRVLR